MQKKSARMRHRYFVRTQYGVIEAVIKIKSLSYMLIKLCILAKMAMSLVGLPAIVFNYGHKTFLSLIGMR
ncbi:hypothetical protein ARSQ2_00818 [Arsenophonus endosymbiont of Bemisia tabaci Q2]|nr:hypothetical protein ARSQ2_00818 [Arsenophonus endosymbiont of Bemisia tabaci Q2]